MTSLREGVAVSGSQIQESRVRGRVEGLFLESEEGRDHGRFLTPDPGRAAARSIRCRGR